jgi:secreted Zn-dependent insulinase-like peptidase
LKVEVVLYRVICVSLFALLVGWLASCSYQQTNSQTSSDAAVAVIKSPNDGRDYRYLTLPNRLRVLLASDPDVDKAAASLVVLRGQNHDPAEFGGLAHFLEHMLFIGTEKYPDVDAYQRFISANGGSSNAYTAADHTNYFFDIHPDYFQEGLDRFAHFFIDPLLDPAYVEREKNAVHSEYQLQKKDDGWRGNSAFKASMNQDHPGARFHIGSLETLGDGVQDALLDFFAANYSADQMILVAITNEPLDVMEAWIAPMFGAIPDRDIGPAAPMPEAFKSDDLPLALSYQSLRDTKQVLYNFPVPPTEPFYRQKPALYISNLLGHEGSGSLHKRLKQQGLIESLSAGVKDLDPQNAFISVDMVLTDKGAENIEQITKLLFAYIDMLREAPIEEWRYEEQARMSELAFRFQEQSSPTGFAYRVGPLLSHFPPQDVLVAPYLMEQFDPELIQKYLSHLRPDNLLLEIVGPDIAADKVEPWFNVPYRVTAFDQALAAASRQHRDGLVLPTSNAFIPDALSLLDNDAAGPEKVVDQAGINLWLDRDTEFGAPRANVYLTLGLQDGLTQPDDLVLAQLYNRLLTDARNELTYPALLAGLAYGLSVSSAGFNLQLSGYTEKQPQLLGAVLENFTQLPIDPDKFALYQAELIRAWGNFNRERPYTQTLASVGQLLLDDRWPPAQLAQALQNKSVADLERWRQERLGAFSIEGLVHGNFSAADVEAMAQLTAEHLPLADFALHKRSVRELDERLYLEVPIDHEDASMVLYIQDQDSSVATRARSALAVQLLRQAYFTNLRTEQQLGYVVSLSSRSLHDRGGLTFIVQSPIASAAALQQATQRFLESQINVVAAMEQEVFEQNKAGLIARLTESDKNLNQRSERYWADLDLGVLSFDSAQQISQQVATLDKAEMLKFLEAALSKLNSESLLIFSRGKFEDLPSGGKAITDIAAFKRR